MSKYVFVSEQKVLLNFDHTKGEKFILVCLVKFHSDRFSDFFEHSDSAAWEKAVQASRPHSICSHQHILDIFNAVCQVLVDQEMEDIENARLLAMSHVQC